MAYAAGSGNYISRPVWYIGSGQKCRRSVIYRGKQVVGMGGRIGTVMEQDRGNTGSDLPWGGRTGALPYTDLLPGALPFSRKLHSHGSGTAYFTHPIILLRRSRSFIFSLLPAKTAAL